MRRRIIAVIALIPALLFGCAGPTTNTTAQTGNTSSQEVAQEDSTQRTVPLISCILIMQPWKKFTCATSQIAIMIRKPAQVTCHTLRAGFCLA